MLMCHFSFISVRLLTRGHICSESIPDGGVAAVALHSAAAPAQGLHAATQRLQYCFGVSLQATDSQNVLVTRAARAEDGWGVGGGGLTQT